MAWFFSLKLVMEKLGSRAQKVGEGRADGFCPWKLRKVRTVGFVFLNMAVIRAGWDDTFQTSPF